MKKMRKIGEMGENGRLPPELKEWMGKKRELGKIV